jgi:hypothetical protein
MPHEVRMEYTDSFGRHLNKIESTAYVGGGGGSRTRVRNRCQPGESMLSPVPHVFASRAQNGQDARAASPMILWLQHGPSRSHQPAVRRPFAAHRRSRGGRLLI